MCITARLHAEKVWVASFHLHRLALRIYSIHISTHQHSKVPHAYDPQTASLCKVLLLKRAMPGH